MKKTLITIVIILVVIVGGYIVYDQLATDNETEPADTNKETDIDDSDTVEDTVVETNGDVNDAGNAFEREFVAKGVWGSVPAITVDVNDVPHVAFYNREFGDLIYATKTNGLWQHEIVDSEGDVATEKGIAVEPNGTIHIAYKDTTNGDTKYAVKSGGTWEISVLDDVPETHHTVYIDLELDSNNIPHVVYHTELNQSMDQDTNQMSIVKYAVKNSDTWDIKEIADNGQFTQLALDADDQPHILYVIEPKEQTIYAYKSNGQWVYDQIDSDAGNRRDVDISINQKTGSIHVIYHDTDGGLLKHYKRDSDGNEVIETMDTGLKTSGMGHKGIKLGLDPDGNPHVVHYSGTRHGFVHAAKTAGEWTHELIDKMGYPAVAVDSQGQVHVAHTYPLGGQREMALEVVEREEDDFEQIVYQLVQ